MTKTVTNRGAQEGIEFGENFLDYLKGWKPLGKRLSEQQRLAETNPEASMAGLGAKASQAVRDKELEASFVSNGNRDNDLARMAKAKATSSLAAGNEALNRREGVWSQLAQLRQQNRLELLDQMGKSARATMSVYQNSTTEVPYGTPMDMLKGQRG